MIAFLLLILSLNFLPACAQENFTTLADYPDTTKFLNFDSANLSKKQKRKSLYYGQIVKYIMDFDDEHNSKTMDFVHDDDGHFYKLTKNDKVKKSKRKTVLVNTNSSEAIGVQRTLVIPVGDPEASTGSFIFTPSALNRIFFSSEDLSLNSYYKEVSSNKTSFEGVQTEFLSVRGLCEGGDIFESGAVDFLFGYVDSQIDLSKFDRVSFVFPDDSFCLGGALGVGTLGKASYRNQFGNDTNISINYNRSIGLDSNNLVYFLKVLAHEFGHNFGLKHDNANACGEEIFTQECEDSLEYGGVHSMMGRSPNLAHFNAIHQYDLKWLENNQVEILEDDLIDAEFTLIPLASNSRSGLKAVKIKRNDGSYYTIEYRRPINMESFSYSSSSLRYGGVQIYLNNDAHNRDSVLIRKDFKVFDTEDSSETLEILERSSFGPSDDFYDPVSDIRIITTNASNNSASFRIEKGTAGAGAGVSDVDETLLSTSQDSYLLKAKGITKTALGIVFEGPSLNNAIVKVNIPRIYRKFIKIKKRKRRLSSNRAVFDVKFAALKKFSNKLLANTAGQYSINLYVEVFDKSRSIVTKSETVTVLLENPRL